MRAMILCSFLMIGGCATQADDPEATAPSDAEAAKAQIDRGLQPTEVPPELQPQASGQCVFTYPGTWGCYGDNWCNSYCTHAGDSKFGYWFSCVKKPTHWETVCVCCG